MGEPTPVSAPAGAAIPTAIPIAAVPTIKCAAARRLLYQDATSGFVFIRTPFFCLDGRVDAESTIGRVERQTISPDAYVCAIRSRRFRPGWAAMRAVCVSSDAAGADPANYAGPVLGKPSSRVPPRNWQTHLVQEAARHT